MLTETPIVEENVRIPGQGRVLEGALAYPADRVCFSALIAGPHPFLGGDMRNNVVRMLLQALASQGAAVLTFNYGGVGGSEGGPADWPAVMSAFWKDGTFKEEHDWADDTNSAILTLGQWCELPPVLVGYSFGCWTIAGSLQASHTAPVVLISPNPKQHTFARLSACAAPLLVIHSDNDFSFTASELIAWFETLREPKTRIELPAGEHFFRGHEDAVARAVLAFLQQYDVH